MKSVSIILPVYNESDVIEKVVLGFYEVAKKYGKAELIIAEDGSNDGTKKILEKLKKKIKFRLVSSDKRKGYFRAVKDALQLSNSQLVFFSDTDGTHDPEDFWVLLKTMQKNKADIISRTKKNRKDSFYRIAFLSFIIY